MVSHRCFTPPRSSILCGCINIPGRQVNAVWGRYPTAWGRYVDTLPRGMYEVDVCKKKAGSLLGALRQNLSCLRVEKLGCVGSRQVIPASCLSQHFDGQLSPCLRWSSRSPRAPLTCLCVAPPEESPAYTYLKQPLRPLQVFTLSQSLFCLLLQPILT